MKRFLSIIMAIALVLTLGACGKNEVKQDVVTVPYLPPVSEQQNESIETVVEENKDIAEDIVNTIETIESEDKTDALSTEEYAKILASAINNDNVGVLMDAGDMMTIKILANAESEKSLVEMFMNIEGQTGSLTTYTDKEKTITLTQSPDGVQYALGTPSSEENSGMSGMVSKDNVSILPQNATSDMFSFERTEEINGIKFDVVKIIVPAEEPECYYYNIRGEWNGEPMEFSYSKNEDDTWYIGYGAPEEIDPEYTPDTKWTIDLDNKVITNGAETIEIEVEPAITFEYESQKPTEMFAYIDRENKKLDKITVEQEEMVITIRFIDEEIVEPVIPDGATEVTEEELGMTLFAFILSFAAIAGGM